jgi:hypothetical protein
MQGMACYSKNIEFHFFVLFLKSKRRKISVFNDFKSFNSAHFLMTQIDEFFTVCSLNQKEFISVKIFILSRLVPEI